MSRSSDTVDVEVGARIRIRRRLLGLTQEELAQAIGVTFQQVQKYEKGTNRVSASMLVKVAHRLETTVAALVGEDEVEPVATEVYRQLASPGAIELLEAFTSLRSSEARQAVLKLVTAMAETADGKSAAA